MSYKRLVTLYKSHSHQNAGASPLAGVYLLALAANEKTLRTFFFFFSVSKRWRIRKVSETEKMGGGEGEGQMKTETMKVSAADKEEWQDANLRETLQIKQRQGREEGVISASPEERRVGRAWTWLHTHTHTHTVTCTHTHTHTHTHTDAFPCKQLGHAGRLGGRM